MSHSCEVCGYNGTTWEIERIEVFEGAIDSTGEVCADGDPEIETTIKCPTCGEGQEDLIANITEGDRVTP